MDRAACPNVPPPNTRHKTRVTRDHELIISSVVHDTRVSCDGECLSLIIRLSHCWVRHAISPRFCVSQSSHSMHWLMWARALVFLSTVPLSNAPKALRNVFWTLWASRSRRIIPNPFFSTWQPWGSHAFFVHWETTYLNPHIHISDLSVNCKPSSL